ncbi:MAG: SIMPL domain-containing protein [Patescibacteria group bacterium]|nr:SIMPL domain-containing protein [Patescibacteria group bacterium]
MDTKIRNYLGVAAIILALSAAVGIFLYVSYYAQNVALGRTFSASGNGEVVAIPDVAQMTVSVVTQGGKDIASIQSQNTTKANAIISFLKSQGVESKDIQTQAYNLEPRYTYYNCGSGSTSCPPPTISGYTITQSIQVKIRDFTKIGGVVSGVVQNGANSISQLSFTVDNPSKYEDQARSEAISKAEARAQAIASESGFKLGKLVSVDVTVNNQPTPVPVYGMGVLNAAASPNIEPGSQKVSVTATLKYEIN